MKREIISGVFILVIAAAASADAWSKGEGKGDGMRSDHPKGQMDRDKGNEGTYRQETKENVRKHRDSDDAKERREEKAYREDQNDSDKPASLAKQREKKAAQEQKELGRGSEQGQKAREEHSRKWWKIWGE